MFIFQLKPKSASFSLDLGQLKQCVSPDAALLAWLNTSYKHYDNNYSYS